ncbi:tumor necrosis factor ligand superfamily member 18 [Sigmodon hispidus]
MEDIPLSQPSPRGAQRFRKPWLLCLVPLLLLLFYTTGALIFTYLKPTAKDPCMVKFELSKSKWQMTSPEPLCVTMTPNGKLEILQDGMYLIYGQVTPVAKEDVKIPADFIVDLVKKENDVLQSATNDFQTLTIGGIYELLAGDTIYLKFNCDSHVQKNNTYWGIVLMPELAFSS